MKKNRLLISIIVMLNLCVANVFAMELYNVSEWAEEEVSKARIVGIDDAGGYDYSRDITRLEFCKFAMNACVRLDIECPANFDIHFSDTDRWEASLAYELGITEGVSETEFAPDKAITREEMAVMLGRMAKLKIDAEAFADLSVFEDAGKISPWATEDMSAMVAAGIIKGVSDTRIAPEENVSIEQGVVLVWRIYRLLGGEDVMTLEDTTSDILVELGITTKEELEKNTNITTLEFFEVIAKASGRYSNETGDISEWYRGNELAELDYLEDSKKSLLLRLNGGDVILKRSEILSFKPDKAITNYEALIYILRMVGDTYGCTDSVADNVKLDKEFVYNLAYWKGLIPSADMQSADVPIKRSELYSILHKAMFVEYGRGGYSGITYYRLIDNFLEMQEEAEEPTTEKEKVRLPISAEFNNDMSVKWEIPEEYSFLSEYMTEIKLIYKDGAEKRKVLSTAATCDITSEEIIKYLIGERDKEWSAIRCIYSRLGEEKDYYFDIDISNVKIVTEGEEIKPGVYTKFNGSWIAKEISLAEGENFEKGCYYILKGVEDIYRKAEYNKVSYEVFKAVENTSSFIAPTNRTFGVSVSDKIYIQKLTVRGNAEEGFVLSVTPESANEFMVEKSADKIY